MSGVEVQERRSNHFKMRRERESEQINNFTALPDFSSRRGNICRIGEPLAHMLHQRRRWQVSGLEQPSVDSSTASSLFL